mmetsp:Transcript_62396/g.136391  ORF Transcript_62396/g.136391 Transcript_62396/m.136391 type:complete len:189 (-) Transcript_62396:44-610(-)
MASLRQPSRMEVPAGISDRERRFQPVHENSLPQMRSRSTSRTGTSVCGRVKRSLNKMLEPTDSVAFRRPCASCLKRPATSMCLPCGHLCLCLPCSEELTLRAVIGEEHNPCPCCSVNVSYLLDATPSELFVPRPSTAAVAVETASTMIRCVKNSSAMAAASDRCRGARKRAASGLHHSLRTVVRASWE